MVTYPDLSSLSNDSGIGGLLQVPPSAYPYYWLWIMAALWAIITTTLYFKEKERKGFGFLLASMAIAGFAIILLSTIGTVVGFISVEIMVFILVFVLLIIGIWFFFSNS